jgi:hypothetical protein
MVRSAKGAPVRQGAVGEMPGDRLDHRHFEQFRHSGANAPSKPDPARPPYSHEEVANMADEYVVNGLVRRRAELAGEIENTQKKLGDLVEDLQHLDSVILQFDPSYEIKSITPKAWRPPEHWSKRGEMSRVILGILGRLQSL